MAFYSPVRHSLKIDLELLFFLLSVFLFLVGVAATILVQQTYQERPVLDSIIAREKIAVATQGSPLASQKSSVIMQETPVFSGEIRKSRYMSPSTAVETPLSVALQDLLKGPNASEKAAGYYSEVPEGTRLLGVTSQGNTVTVNLSKEFAVSDGATSLIQRVEEVRKTVKSVNKNNKLKFAIEGKPVTVIGGLEVVEEVTQ